MQILMICFIYMYKMDRRALLHNFALLPWSTVYIILIQHFTIPHIIILQQDLPQPFCIFLLREHLSVSRVLNSTELHEVRCMPILTPEIYRDISTRVFSYFHAM